jgi:hypothetical protein
MADSWRIHDRFMANGFAKVDNGFGYEKWTQGGSIGVEFARGMSDKARGEYRGRYL